MARERNDNDRLLDEQLLSFILALVRSEKLGREAVAIINETEPELAAMIRASRTGLVTRQDTTRMNKLLGDIRTSRAIAWRRVEVLVRRELERLAKSEPRVMRTAIRNVSDEKIRMPTEAVLLALLAGKFEGRTLSEWIRVQRENDFARIATQVRLGKMLREPPDRTARRVLGEARLLGANGATEQTRQRLFEITTLAGLFIANQARREFVILNGDLFDRELYVAVLDNRTTPICRSLHGKVFEIGVGPYPPLHFWCRSLRIALLRGVGPPVFLGWAAWLADQDEDTQEIIRRAGRDRQFEA